jgi:hypothetical protein
MLISKAFDIYFSLKGVLIITIFQKWLPIISLYSRYFLILYSLILLFSFKPTILLKFFVLPLFKDVYAYQSKNSNYFFLSGFFTEVPNQAVKAL